MVTIEIGGDPRPIQHADASWIANELGGRQHQNGSVCVSVNVQEPGANFRLITPGCGSGRGTKTLSPLETEILALWIDHRMNTNDFTVGNLISFVRRLVRLLDLAA
jgi:hypothetical protein